MKLSQEARIDAELAGLGVRAYITHMKQPDDGYFKRITVAAPAYEPYSRLGVVLSACTLEAYADRRSDLGTVFINGFAKVGMGVALCHHLDNFDRKLGRIIAEGRLLKLRRTQS